MGHPHVAAVALAIVADLAIYPITADSDLFLALATGAAGGVMTWLALGVELWFQKSKVP